MRTLVVAALAFILLAGAVAGGWFAMNNAGGTVGTPAHAGAVSNGHPEQCTNVNFSVPRRSQAKRTVLLAANTSVRGTFEADGGFGGVDLLMRVVSPQNLEMLASPRAGHYDFSFPVKLSGEYTFVFDNRFSMYTPKSVGLYYCVDGGKPLTPGEAQRAGS
jgi:hypothetical protein